MKKKPIILTIAKGKMEHTKTANENSYLEKIISADDYHQIDIISKLFKCSFEDALSAVLQTDGTFGSVSEKLHNR